VDALPISQRSPTVVPMTRQRCPNVLRRAILVGSWGVPTTTEFSSTADPVLIASSLPLERRTAPSASSTRSPSRADPMSTADPATRVVLGSRS
jgi:hypothetical protein